MNISKINSTPAFRGYISAYVKGHGGTLEQKKFDVDDITSIEEGLGDCNIRTKFGTYKYKYKDSSYYIGGCKYEEETNINNVLNAYIAAKLGGPDFTVKI